MNARRMVSRLVGVAILLVPPVGDARGQGIRVVDMVNVAIARDEASHSFAGDDTSLGEAAGRKWRSATGWFSYSLRIYDDSPLTLVCAFADGAGAREAFDIFVDGRKAATYTREPQESRAGEVRFSLPLAATEGKTAVIVRFQAHAGSRTARLLDVRSVQEHLE